MSTQAINDLSKLLNELTVATDALNVKGKELANRERNYRVALSKAILRGRAEGYPATLLLDICRGLIDVSEARFQRDIAHAYYAGKRINTLNYIRIIDGSYRDLNYREAHMIDLIPTGKTPYCLKFISYDRKAPRTVKQTSSF